MRKLNKNFLFKISLLISLLISVAVGCFGQNEQLRQCKEGDFNCRHNNNVSMMSSKCKEKGYDCWIAECTKIVESNPNDPATYYTRGTFLIIKEPDRAILDFGKVLELNPKYRLTYVMLASIYSKKKQYDQAIAILDKAIELDPKYANAYANRGFAYLQQNNFDKALADYNKSIELEPKNDYGYVGLAMIYREQKDYDKAIANYSKAIELYSYSWNTYFSRGYLYWLQGKKAQANADCQKAKELKPLRDNTKIVIDGYCSL